MLTLALTVLKGPEELECQQVNRNMFLSLLKIFERIKCITTDLTSERSGCGEGEYFTFSSWERHLI